MKSFEHSIPNGKPLPPLTYSYRRTAVEVRLEKNQNRLVSCVHDSRWKRVVNIEISHTAPYYDLTVPKSENYWAEGLWHHNSGKTVACSGEATRHIFHNAGAKVLFVRKTEASQADSTIETILNFFESMDDEWYKETDTSLFRKWNDGRTIRVPSAQAIARYSAMRFTSKSDVRQWMATEGNKWCGFIEMRGLPDSGTSESKLRGFECSMMIIVEADQVTHADFMLALPCLRWKGADPDTCDANGFIKDASVILDTNPPSPRHWIATLEKEELAKPEEKREMRFWHIATYENEHNLPPDYIKRQILLPYSKNPAMIQRMLYGQYAEAFEGKPVFWAFGPEHVGVDLKWPKGAYLVRGWDFGTNNAVTWSAYWMNGKDEYWHVLYEQYLEGSDTDRQAEEALKITANEFPFWNQPEICAGVMDWCDPSGDNSNFSTKATGSSVKILRTHGINPGYKLWERNIEMGLAIMNRLLSKKDSHGGPVFKIDSKWCPILFRAFIGEYRYPEAGQPGYGSNNPLKGDLCGNVDHPQDSLRYGILNTMKLLRTEHEESKKNLPKSRDPNPTALI